MSYRDSRKTDRGFTSILNANDRQDGKVSENDTWKRVKGFLCEGDVDSAYGEALCSHNQRVLIELIDATGPVLDSLSDRTISNLLSSLATGISEQGTAESLIPWLQQVTTFLYQIVWFFDSNISTHLNSTAVVQMQC